MNDSTSPFANRGFMLPRPKRRRLRIDLYGAIVLLILLGFWGAAYCVAYPADPARPGHHFVAEALP